jgi:B12-binding domain/radical SAM domain protein
VFAKTDLILLHAPSVYDFREKNILYGPVSDVVPSTQVFEMYPIGFMSILGYLQSRGYSVRIINIALKMLAIPWFNVERAIRRLKPAAFGIDLHWMVHAHGSLELAALVKKHHPDIPVIFGGLSASYFHRELIQYPQVDYVLRGDSTEEPLRCLLEAIKGGRSPGDVPNLTWKQDGEVREQELTHVPADLDAMSFDYSAIMRSCARHFDILGHLPFKAFFNYPVMAALSCHGCFNNCAICGGSKFAYQKTCHRSKPAYRSPEFLARDIAEGSRHVKGPVMVLGGTLQAGEDYARALLKAIRREGVKCHICFEFFTPPSREILELAAASAPRWNVQMSPESHEDAVRRRFGRMYDTPALEQSIFDALELGCSRFDVFFMIGIPGQTPESVRGTVKYCRELLEKCASAGFKGQLRPFISPLSPFLDPGSRAFEEPEKHGYRLFHRTLEEHRQALLAPSWKYTLNYETEWMSRDQLVEVTYEAAEELNRLKLEHGLLAPRQARRIEVRITRERALMREVDTAYRESEGVEREERLKKLMRRFKTVGPATICKKDEMNWPAALVRFNPFSIIKSAFSALECITRR